MQNSYLYVRIKFFLLAPGRLAERRKQKCAKPTYPPAGYNDQLCGQQFHPQPMFALRVSTTHPNRPKCPPVISPASFALDENHVRSGQNQVGNLADSASSHTFDNLTRTPLLDVKYFASSPKAGATAAHRRDGERALRGEHAGDALKLLPHPLLPSVVDTAAPARIPSPALQPPYPSIVLEVDAG